jgi:hypothetical protein
MPDGSKIHKTLTDLTTHLDVPMHDSLFMKVAKTLEDLGDVHGRQLLV